MKTTELFGVSSGVVRELKKMPHEDYLLIGIALMNVVQKKQVDSYQSKEFIYRANAIKNYEKWVKED